MRFAQAKSAGVRRLGFGGGGGGAAIIGATLPSGDAYWHNVQLLTEFTGPDNSVDFYDEAVKGDNLQANGNTKITSDAAVFDGTGDYINTTNTTAWTFTGDFTLEVFGVKFTTNTTRMGLISQYNATGNQKSWSIEYRGDVAPDDMAFVYSTNGSSGLLGVTAPSWTPTVGQAYDIAVDRSGSTCRMYIDGVWKGSHTLAGSLFASTSQLEIGQGSAKGSNTLNGSMTAARVTNGSARYATDTSYTVPTLPLPRAPTADAMLFSYTSGARVEWFVDQTLIESSASVNFKTMPLVKYASNPIAPVSGTNSDTWDYDKLYVNSIFEGGTYKFWYGNVDSLGAFTGSSYATSTDGNSITKPTLGAVTYDGNTNNNIFNAGYDPSVVKSGSTYYIQIGADSVGASNDQALIYTSADGFTGLSLAKTITHGSTSEFHGLVQRADGRWLSYYVINQGTERRTVCAYLSNTSDVTGTWVDQGALSAFTSSHGLTQYYTIGCYLRNGVLYGLVDHYNQTQQSNRLELFTSTDGLTWVANHRGWVRPGPDAHDIFGYYGKSLVDNGTDLRWYYGGSASAHNSGSPWDARLSYASVPTGRIGSVYGSSGTVITTAFTPTAALYLNSVATSGTLTVEVLNAGDNSVMTNFATGDCDNLDGNFSQKEVTWGGVSLPTGASVKLKFYLAS